MVNKLDFPKRKGLQTRSVIYVPSTTDVNKKISNKQLNKRVDTVRKFVNKNFGGSTSISGIGSFTSEKNKLIKERVVKVEHFTSFPEWKKQDKKTRKFIQRQARKWKQESVGFEFQSPNSKRRFLFIKQSKAKGRKAVNKIA